MVMSAQIDESIVTRYSDEKWLILLGCTGNSPYTSIYSFFREIIGFDLAGFMDRNQNYFQREINSILNRLMRAE